MGLEGSSDAVVAYVAPSDCRPQGMRDCREGESAAHGLVHCLRVTARTLRALICDPLRAEYNLDSAPSPLPETRTRGISTREIPRPVVWNWSASQKAGPVCPFRLHCSSPSPVANITRANGSKSLAGSTFASIRKPAGVGTTFALEKVVLISTSSLPSLILLTISAIVHCVVSSSPDFALQLSSMLGAAELSQAGQSYCVGLIQRVGQRSWRKKR